MDARTFAKKKIAEAIHHFHFFFNLTRHLFSAITITQRERWRLSSTNPEAIAAATAATGCRATAASSCQGQGVQPLAPSLISGTSTLKLMMMKQPEYSHLSNSQGGWNKRGGYLGRYRKKQIHRQKNSLFVTEVTQYCVHGGLQQIRGSLANSLSILISDNFIQK